MKRAWGRRRAKCAGIFISIGAFSVPLGVEVGNYQPVTKTMSKTNDEAIEALNAEEEVCPYCLGTKVVDCDEYDSDSHEWVPTGTCPCECTFGGEDGGDPQLDN